MFITFREYHLPALVLTVIIGYQISVYFLYSYYKRRGERIELNKILLRIGIFFGFSVSAVLIRTINDYYINDIMLSDFLSRLSLILVLIGLVFFISFFLSKSFSGIVNQKITLFILLLNFHTVIALIFIGIDSQLFILLITPIIISYGYFLILNIKLIKRSTGSVKKRLISIFVGEFIFISAFIMARNESFFLILRGYSQEMQVIMTPLVIIGLSIVLIGIYRFPAFVEFEWKENIIKLFIINQNTGMELYNFDFIEFHRISFSDQAIKDKVFTKAIAGIDQIFTALTNTAENKITKIKQGKEFIIFEYGEFFNLKIVYALLVKKEMNSITFFLRNIRNQFQSFYKYILQDISTVRGSEKEIFTSFDVIIKNLIR